MLSETEVKDILMNKEEKIEDIHTKMLSLYQELENSADGDILSAAAMSSPNLSGMLTASVGIKKDLGDILEKYKNMWRERNLAARNMMRELIEEEEHISRVWACFYALGNPHFKILKALYVENQLYQTVEKSLEMSHKTFEKYRKEGILWVIKCYESDASIAQFTRQQETMERFSKNMEAPKKKKGCEQFHLEDYLFLPQNPVAQTERKGHEGK